MFFLTNLDAVGDNGEQHESDDMAMNNDIKQMLNCLGFQNY